MKKKIINSISAILRWIDRILCQIHIKRPVVVLFMDGGICSQMLMYLQGLYYAEHGLDVRYDTKWYDVCGKDQNGIMPRIFEFTEMWPNLPFRKIEGIERWFYRHFFKIGELENATLPEPSTITCSIYLYGYWDLPKGESQNLYDRYFNLQNAASPAVYVKSSFEKVVGIHVRRGDLAKGDSSLYGGVSEGYFLKAIEFCNVKFVPKKYIFFSDEPDWVEQNICPQVKQPYEIIRGNKAWEDLWLLAHCGVIVASQGSFGRVAARLNPDAILIQCDNKYAKRDRSNTYYIK